MLKLKVFCIFGLLFLNGMVFADSDSSDSSDSSDDSGDSGDSKDRIISKQSCIPQWNKNDKVVIDSDGSLSDAFGLINILKASALKKAPPVVGITCIRGPFTNVTQTCKNIAKLLDMVGRTDIPIYLGVDEGYAVTLPLRSSTYGIDAFGDVDISDRLLPTPQAQNALDYMINLVNKYPNQVTILGLGPLTNFAFILQRDSTFFTKVKLFLTGAGTSKGVGDYAPGIESKSVQDPEATKAVLLATSYKNTIQLPYDVTWSVRLGIPSAFWKKFFALSDTYVKAYTRLSAIYRANGSPSGMIFSDPLVAIAYAFPALVTGCSEMRVTVALCGDVRGAFMNDWLNANQHLSTDNLVVLEEINTKALQSTLLALFK